MKTLLLIICFTVCTALLAAQPRTVKLMIDHSTNDDNYQDLRHFEIWDGKVAYMDNLLYYIHDVKIVTDSGDTMGIPGQHFMVDAANQVDYELGTFDADSAVQVLFQWGVSADKNHEDPSQYPLDHPLAHQNPTMHWGWNTGYRFLRADGVVDSNDDNDPDMAFEYHMVGDQFRGPINTDCVSLINDDGELEVWITAHYEHLFNLVDIIGETVIHGWTRPIPTISDNLKSAPVFDVFDGRAPTPPVGVNDPEQQLSFNLWPNPAPEGMVNLTFSEVPSVDGTITIYDMTGKATAQILFPSTHKTISLPQLNPGLYMVRVADHSESISHISRLIIQKAAK